MSLTSSAATASELEGTGGTYLEDAEINANAEPYAFDPGFIAPARYSKASSTTACTRWHTKENLDSFLRPEQLARLQAEETEVPPKPRRNTAVMTKDVRTVQLRQFTDGHANEIAGELEGAQAIAQRVLSA